MYAIRSYYGKNPKYWGKPFAALLGTLFVQKQMEIPAIGGKDSMSGTFNELHVPPTLISFAVSPLKASQVVSQEFKSAGSKLYLVKHTPLDNLMPNMDELKENFDFVHENIKSGKIVATMTLKHGGVAEAISKMSFGNKIGASIKDLGEDLFRLNYGSMVVEAKEELSGIPALVELGETSSTGKIVVGDMEIA